MTRNPLRAPILTLLAALLLAACTPSASTPTPEQTSDPLIEVTPTPEPVAALSVDAAALEGLSLHIWHAFAGEAGLLFSQQVAQFNASNEWGITVVESGYGDYPTLFDAVQSAVEAGELPQMVVALPEQTLTWDASGLVVDLTPYVADPTWGLPAKTVSDFYAPVWAQDEVDGRRLGLPAQRSTRVLYYNQTWAQELGFSTPPANAEEFRTQACAANASFKRDASLQNDGYGGWIVDTDWQATYSWLLGFGGSVTDGDSFRFRTDENLAALEYLKGLYDQNCAWLSTESTPYDSFAGRKALFVSADLSEAWLFTNAMQRAENPDIWTALPFPGTQEKVLTVYGPSYSILRSSPEEQLAAWLFAGWMLAPDAQAQWVETIGLLPLRASVLDAVTPYRSASPQWAAVVDQLSAAHTVPPLAGWRHVRYVLEDGMIVLFHENTPADQLASILTEMDLMAEDLMK